MDLERERLRNTSTTISEGGGTHPDLVLLGNALSDGDNKANLVFNGLNDGVGGGRWGNVENGGIRLGLPHGLRPTQCQNDPPDAAKTMHIPL